MSFEVSICCIRRISVPSCCLHPAAPCSKHRYQPGISGSLPETNRTGPGCQMQVFRYGLQPEWTVHGQVVASSEQLNVTALSHKTCAVPSRGEILLSVVNATSADNRAPSRSGFMVK